MFEEAVATEVIDRGEIDKGEGRGKRSNRGFVNSANHVRCPLLQILP